MTKSTKNQRENNFKQLLGLYLQQKPESNSITSTESHLDDDSAAAFIEGNLSQRETKFVLKHLVNCKLCRSITASLMQLAINFENDVELTSVASSQNENWSKLWNSLTEKVFQFSDDAIFALGEDKEPANRQTADEENQSEKTQKNLPNED